MVFCWCMKWCFYDDPYDKQCRKMVLKNNKRVRCKRYGKIYHKETNRYYCEIHYDELITANIEQLNKEINKRVSTDSSCEYSSSD